MSDRPIKLLLIDQDPIFRTGLRVVFEQFPELQVVAEAESGNAALQFLAQSAATASLTDITVAVDLVLLELGLDHQPSQRKLGLQLCRQLKTQYPNLPLLLLSSLEEPALLATLRQAGVDGYCLKGIAVSELVAAMRQVAAGYSYWVDTKLGTVVQTKVQPLAPLRNHLRWSGLRQIDTALAEVTAQLQIPGIPLLDQAILAGQRRELLAARWVVNQLLAQPEGKTQELEVGFKQPKTNPELDNRSTDLARKTGLSTKRIGNSSLDSALNNRLETRGTTEPAEAGTRPAPTGSQMIRMQSTLFESTLAKIQFSLQNLTSVPLEIDIFRAEKKRELLALILQKIEGMLDELRFSRVQLSQLQELQPVIVRDLWQAATTDFFGKYSTLRASERELEIVSFLLQDTVIVQTAILDKIPLVVDLFSYLLFQTPLVIDNASYPFSSLEATERAEVLLQNLLIQIANGVVQPLLNKIADLEAIKHSFYDRRLISTREIERFRNNLSWKYRLEKYISEPKAIFESRYDLLVLASRGIAKISIYAPRSQELAQLSGIQLLVTLVLEARDAIAPVLRAAAEFVGSGIVYIFTQVIGRAIGLIGRGILQGIKTR